MYSMFSMVSAYVDAGVLTITLMYIWKPLKPLWYDINIFQRHWDMLNDMWESKKISKTWF